MKSTVDFPDELIASLRSAQRVTVLTGAGISAESGIPTFREAGTGLWAKYRPEELATPQAFQRDPKLVWDWYSWRRELVNRAEPNLGHYSLVIMETWLPDFRLVTQNVDGLHQRAGSSRVIELHGNIHRNKCFREGTIVVHNDGPSEGPPSCPNCGAYLRPDVVWFGEGIPEENLHQAWVAAENCELFFSIGTSALVQPAASLPMVAFERGVRIIEINIGKTPISGYASFTLSGPSAKILPLLVKLCWPESS